MNLNQVLFPTDWKEYEIIDSGDGEKLEKIGGYCIVRPDPRIIWSKSASGDVWNSFDARFIRSNAVEGHWNIRKQPPTSWHISYKNLVFTLRPTEFKHFGVFPEQAVNWDWMTTIIKKNLQSNHQMKILNLFAYTGGATLAGLAAGAEVTHVDSVKSAIDWANDNIKASNLTNSPVRWIIDDAVKFVIKEAKRGNTYDGIIMDPPRFGRGPKGEVWKLEKDLPKLLESVKPILSPNLKFFLLNAYTADISPIALTNAVTDILGDRIGEFESGELTLRETFGNRLIPNGIFVRWSKNQ